MSAVTQKIDLSLLIKTVEVKVEQDYAIIRKAILDSTLINSIEVGIRNEKTLRMNQGVIDIDDYILLSENRLTMNMDCSLCIELVLKDMLVYDSDINIKVSPSGLEGDLSKFLVNIEFNM